MYSIVLMMAVSGAPQTENWGGGWTAHGNYSCGGCGGCVGAGGWGYGQFPAYSSHACSGCAGNVTTYHSCLGYRPDYWMTFSCFGYGYYGGTTYNFPTPIPPPMTSYGYGYPMPVPVESSMPRILNKDSKKTEEVKPKPMSLRREPAKAKVVVRLPADAKLFANGEQTDLTSAERRFSTPLIDPGVDYQYTMKIEYIRDGSLLSDSQVVKVRAGETSTVEFADKSPTKAAAKVIQTAAPERPTFSLNGRTVPNR